MNWKKRSLLVFAAVMLMFALMATSAMAYFDRGPVKITAAQNSVSVAAGKSVTVSVSTSPSSDKQLPGCGMAECPQSCDEKNCLNADGECTCAGTTYKTYYTDVNVSSGNSSVAKASYNNGVLTVKGVSAGETDIKITAMLRQYTSTSQTIHVTVLGNASSQAGQTTAKPAPAQATAGGSVEVVANQQDSSEVQESAVTQEAENYSVNSDKGLIHFVAVQEGAMGQADMATVMGKNESVVFQKKDTSGTILYSWEFAGKDLEQPQDMDFAIAIDSKLPDTLQSMVKGNALYLDFAHDGDLPGKATVNVQLGDKFNADSELKLYYYNEETGALELVADQLKIENGYVAFPLEHCSAYVLADGDLAAGGMNWWVIAIAVVIIVAVIAIIIIRSRKHKTV